MGEKSTRIAAELGLQPLDRLLAMSAVRTIIPYSKAQIYRKVADGSFPAPMKIGKARVAWRQSDIAKWMAEQSQADERCAA
jgi:prophage regulatory protein